MCRAAASPRALAQRWRDFLATQPAVWRRRRRPDRGEAAPQLQEPFRPAHEPDMQVRAALAPATDVHSLIPSTRSTACSTRTISCPSSAASAGERSPRSRCSCGSSRTTTGRPDGCGSEKSRQPSSLQRAPVSGRRPGAPAIGGVLTVSRRLRSGRGRAASCGARPRTGTCPIPRRPASAGGRSSRRPAIARP